MKIKATTLAFLFCVCFAECRKIVKPQLDKNANTAFITQEMGGGPFQPKNVPAVAPTSQGKAQPAQPALIQPAQPKPASPTPTPAHAAPVKPAAPAPAKPAAPAQIKPVPVNPAPVAHPVTTPGPGTVKQLVNFYDSQGKASPIRPYSYAQAVKQGKS